MVFGCLKITIIPKTIGIKVKAIVTLLKSVAGISFRIGSLKTYPNLPSFQHIKEENNATDKKPENTNSQKDIAVFLFDKNRCHWSFNIRMNICKPYILF